MTKLEKYLNEVEQLLLYKEYNQLTKKLIDLSLDTEDTTHYEYMLKHLDWLDFHLNPSTEELHERYSTLFFRLKETLSKKVIKEETQVLISIQNLIKTYAGGAFTLGPINLELKENQMLGLVGENGNGKTTLLRVLARDLEYEQGKILYRFDYEDDYDLRSRLVYIEQRTPVWNGMLLENLRYTAAMYGLKGIENEMKVDLIIARMGIRKFRNFAWRGLSSGYKMRFELARALLRNPRVMLIDEPLANLDILAQKNVLDDLRGICSSPFRPMGIMLSSQQLYEVEKNSDDVLFLKNGKQKNLFTPTEEQMLQLEQTINNTDPYIIEFETPWEMGQVRAMLEGINYINLQLNGGTYIATLPYTVSYDLFLRHTLEAKMPMTYFRDISKSTRRFFLS